MASPGARSRERSGLEDWRSGPRGVRSLSPRTKCNRRGSSLGFDRSPGHTSQSPPGTGTPARRSGYERESASVAVQKRLDGHQASRCGRSGSGLPARLGGARSDGAATTGESSPSAGAGAAGRCPPRLPSCGQTATGPTGPGRRLSPAPCTHSIWHAAGLVVTSCADATWYESWSTSPGDWVPDVVAHLPPPCLTQIPESGLSPP